MDIDRFRRGLTISVRSVVFREWRLFGGMVLWLVAYTLWVGATGAAISQFTSLLSITVDPWTTETTVAALVTVTLWILLPAGVATYLVVRELTNVSGNIADHYRIHPVLLLVPPLVGIALTAGALGVLGGDNRTLLVATALAALFFHIRALAYSYRVFSLSYPRIQQLSLFGTATVLLFALLVEGGTAVGQDAFVFDAVTGLGDAVGIADAGAFVDGTSTIAGLSVPTSYGLAIATPLVLGGGYVCLQILVGVAVRLRGKAIPRSKLRTGQRYPEFARPTTTKQSSLSNTTRQKTTPSAAVDGTNGANTDAGSSGGTDAGSSGGTDAGSTPGTESQSGAPAGTGMSADAADSGDTTSGRSGGSQNPADEDQEDVTHTRVFTPSATDDQTAVDSGEECPFCGADLGSGAETCHNCGASL